MEIERQKLVLESEKLAMDLEIAKLQSATQMKTAETSAKASAEQAKEPKEKPEKAEKPEPVVINVMPAAAPNVNVEAPVINMPEQKRGKRRSKMTGPDGKEYTMESEDDDAE
mgnify:CR=1 FL=1